MNQIHYLNVLIEKGRYIFNTTERDQNNPLPDIKALFIPF